MIENATAETHAGHGTAPWTRLNDLQPNTLYPSTEPPSLPARPRDVDAQISQYTQDLFDLFGPDVAVTNPIELASPSGDSSGEAVLLFSIGIHIEPMGAQVSEIALAAGPLQRRARIHASPTATINRTSSGTQRTFETS